MKHRMMTTPTATLDRTTDRHNFAFSFYSFLGCWSLQYELTTNRIPCNIKKCEKKLHNSMDDYGMVGGESEMRKRRRTKRKLLD